VKITFIRPHLTARPAADALEPLVFGILARLTPPEVDLALYDDRIEPIPFEQPTDLVAITVETFTAKRAYQIAARFRKRGIPVIMGGYHPTLLPAEAAQYADAVAVGDAEAVWPRIVEDARNGRLQSRYESRPSLAVEGAAPQRSIFMGKRYGPVRLVQVGRGCRFACDFCSIHAFYGRSMPRRCIDNLLAELEELRGQYVFFADDNLFTDREQAQALFKLLRQFDLHWACQISLDIVQHPQLLDSMGGSGCVGALIGFESLNAANLTQMKKKWNTKLGGYAGALAKIYARGIMVFGSFVFGYDHDTTEAFDRTLEFAMNSKLALAQFNPLFPTPGTPLYARLQSEGRLRYRRWWLDDDYRYGESLFRPARMTPDELREGVIRLRREFNACGAIAARMAHPQANARSFHHMFFYLMTNLVSRREIRNKQGRALGDGSPLNDIPSTAGPSNVPRAAPQPPAAPAHAGGR
jgi:radical SAM superfamily enzyme YgiQ (UPF0313 family)